MRWWKRAERAAQVLDQLRAHAERTGIPLSFTANSPYVNTIPYDNQPPFPGDQEIERRIKSIIRWNALAMVVRANRLEHNIGGHISTYASQATLRQSPTPQFRRRLERRKTDVQCFPFLSQKGNPRLRESAVVRARLVS